MLSATLPCSAKGDISANSLSIFDPYMEAIPRVYFR
jgi:hypothetical protein